MSYKKELLDTIEKQKLKIASYEKRLHDLIKAYKGIQKEKEALELSLSALSNPQNESVEDPTEISSQECKGSSDPLEVVESDCESTVSNTDNSEYGTLKKKIAMLQSSLKTLNAERSKTETLLKEDRKKILDEKKKIELDFKQYQTSSSKLVKETEQKLIETKKKLTICQQDREKETNNGMTMLRELEVRLAKERQDKEKLESTLHELKEKYRSVSLVSKSNERDQKQITDLQNELQQVKHQFKRTVHQIQEPPLLKELQSQLQSMEIQYKQAHLHERQRAEEAEKALRDQSAAHENRVSTLENRLAELSLNAARYDRAKQSQLETISSLKERLEELSHTPPENVSKVSHEINCDSNENIDNLIKNLVDIWEKILLNDDTVNVESYLKDNELIHASCKEKYDILKNQLTNDVNMKCTCGLSSQIDELQDKVKSLTSSIELREKAHAGQVSILSAEVASQKSLHDAKVRQLEHDHKVAIGQLESQLSEHCQRSLRTLQEREEEIHRLSLDLHQMNKDAQDQPRTVAAALLAQVDCGLTEAPLLHHWEEMSRKDLEIIELRKERKLLERALKDIQSAAIEKQEMLANKIEDLESEVSRQTRNVSREGENLEYLKNVVLQYMTSSSVESKHLILNAIAAVLKFTPAEIESVRSYLELWWWQGSRQVTQGRRKGSVIENSK